MLQYVKSVQADAPRTSRPACTPASPRTRSSHPVREALTPAGGRPLRPQRRRRLPHPQPGRGRLGAHPQRRQPQAGRCAPHLPGDPRVPLAAAALVPAGGREAVQGRPRHPGPDRRRGRHHLPGPLRRRRGRSGRELADGDARPQPRRAQRHLLGRRRSMATSTTSSARSSVPAPSSPSRSERRGRRPRRPSSPRSGGASRTTAPSSASGSPRRACPAASTSAATTGARPKA